jgi:diguanylate cyclase (GGDEF)-like protein
MTVDVIHLLIVEDSQEYARMLETVLSAEDSVSFDLTHVDDLEKALSVLDKNSFDVILLDLSLPDSLGLDTFLSIYARAPFIPIVVITALDDEAVALKAVREGAQDYLVKGDLVVGHLIRSLRYAVERHHTLTTMEQRMLTDDLTGLYNRRGFMHLAVQQVKLAHRMKTDLLLIFVDLDGLKDINDTYGHNQGDQALIDVAKILKITFRSTDIIARVGGDEFVALAINVNEDSDQVLDGRLKENLDAFNTRDVRPYTLAMSWGLVFYSPESPLSLEDLLEEADAAMYERKRNKKNTPRV